jgi:hypothetical protein
MSNTSNIYSLLEQQIKVYLQAVVQQIAGYDDTYEKRTVAKLGQHFVEVYTSFDAYEIAVFHEETRELFAYAKYDREKEIVLYALKFHVVKDCLNELIKQDV